MIRSSEAASCRNAFGKCRRVEREANAAMAIVAEVVRAEPGLTMAEVANRVAGKVPWRDPLSAIQRHACGGTGRLQKAGVRVVRNGRHVTLWPREEAA